MDINWDAVGAVAEFLGASAVLATLLYLSVQVRNSREELRYSIRQNRGAVVREFVMETVRDDDLRRVMKKARLANGDELPLAFQKLIDAFGLSYDEAHKLNAYFLAQWLYRVTALQNIEDFSQSERAAFEQQLHGNYSKGIESVWLNALREDFGDMAAEIPIFSHIDWVINERGAGKQHVVDGSS